MKRMKLLLAVLMAQSLLLAGCDSTENPTDVTSDVTTDVTTDVITEVTTNASTEVTTDIPLGDGVWENVCGSYAWDESSQYTNSVLSMMWLDYGCVLFEFKLMEGSEEEDSAMDLTVSGVLNVLEDGSGIYEAVGDDGNVNLKILFNMSEDGSQMIISHEGELPISPDGNYTFTDSGMEVSDYSATELVRYLPTAATSLNANLGAYTINYPETIVSDWFYPIDVTFDDSGEYLAKFLVAKDLSAVFRVDDDIEPVLIFGSAQPMLDAETWPEYYEEYDEEYDEEELIAESTYEPIPLVSAETDNGTFLAVGESTKLLVNQPWELPFTLEANSSDTSIAEVDENGVITAIGTGEASITGTLTIEDGVKEFEIIISVLDEEATEE